MSILDSYPAFYEVTVWNEFKKEQEKLHGVTFGKSWAEVAQNLEEYYGDTLISMTIELQEENTVFEFEINEDILKKYFDSKATD